MPETKEPDSLESFVLPNDLLRPYNGARSNQRALAMRATHRRQKLSQELLESRARGEGGGHSFKLAAGSSLVQAVSPANARRCIFVFQHHVGYRATGWRRICCCDAELAAVSAGKAGCSWSHAPRRIPARAG